MKLNKLMIVLLAGLSLAAVGCEETEDTDRHYKNKLFIDASSYTENVLFTTGENETIEAGIAVAIAKPVDYDITAEVEPAPELLSTYQAAYYDETAVVLPEAYYSMPETTATINAGSISSPSLDIEFLNTGDLDINTVYVLPVSISSTSGMDVLESARNYYYVLKGSSLINVVCNISQNRAYPDFNDDPAFSNLTQNTMEILFKASSFPNTLHTLMGIEGNYLLRIGDAGIPANQLQIATSAGNVSNSDLQFESGEWYHVAVTFDAGNIVVYINGVEKCSDSVSKSYVDISAAHTNEENGDRCFWVGYAYSSDRYLDGVVSEARIWNRVLSAEEIQEENHFYTVDPDSEGLIAYWKFNEGSGTIAKDSSVSGYDLTIENEPTWESVSLPE